MVEEYIVAERRCCDLNNAAEDMLTGTAHGPEVLAWRDSDATMELPWTFAGDKANFPYWDRARDVDALREARWSRREKTETDDELVVRFVKFTPSSEARARADEIIAAFDQWQSDCKKWPRGYKKAVREVDTAERTYERIQRQIAKKRATTIEGLYAKVRCAVAYEKEGARITEINSGGCAETMATSIFRDLEALVASGRQSN